MNQVNFAVPDAGAEFLAAAPSPSAAVFTQPDPVAGTLTSSHPAGPVDTSLAHPESVSLSATRETNVKPRIQVSPGRINEIANEAEAALAAMGRHYQHGGAIVTVQAGGSGVITVIPVTAKSLMRDLDQAAAWETQDRSGEWRPANPPSLYCSVLADARGYKHLRVLTGVARQPFLRTEGSLCRNAGYDAATGLYAAFDDVEFDVPVSPSLNDAMAAWRLLDALLSEFTFPDEGDRSAALSAMLTAAIRPSLNLAPMFHARAPQSGSGKSLLCEIITAFATSRPGSPLSFPTNDAECSKLLLAEMIGSPGVVEFDNLTGDIFPYKSLCTALTSEHLTGRILGASKMVSVNTRTLILSSGNNVGPVADMSRRCITINIEPASEIPSTHVFLRPDLASEVRAARGRYVTAALTIIRAWVVAGSPHTACKPLNGYQHWSDWCRQPLLWLGLADPAAGTFKGIGDDPDRMTLSRLLAALHAAFGTTPVMVKEMVRRAHDRGLADEELLEVLQDIAGGSSPINRKRLGQWLKKNSGRAVDGLKITKSLLNRNAVAWQVEPVVPILPVVSVLSVSVVPANTDLACANDADLGDLLGESAERPLQAHGG